MERSGKADYRKPRSSRGEGPVLVRAPKTRTLTGRQKAKTMMTCQAEMKVLLEPDLELMYISFWQRTCLHCVYSLRLCGKLDLTAKNNREREKEREGEEEKKKEEEEEEE